MITVIFGFSPAKKTEENNLEITVKVHKVHRTVGVTA